MGTVYESQLLRPYGRNYCDLFTNYTEVINMPEKHFKKNRSEVHTFRSKAQIEKQEKAQALYNQLELALDDFLDVFLYYYTHTLKYRKKTPLEQ